MILEGIGWVWHPPSGLFSEAWCKKVLSAVQALLVLELNNIKRIGV